MHLTTPNAFDVCDAALDIIRSLVPVYDEDIVAYAALLHDTRDRKYPNSITLEQLSDFVISQLGSVKASCVLWIIDNLSWSGESTGKYPRSSEIWDRDDQRSTGLPKAKTRAEDGDCYIKEIYLVVIRDADRIQALGEKGLERCLQLAKARGMTDRDGKINAWDHCREKLLRLMPERFIVTPRGRELAQPGHDWISRWYSYGNGLWVGGGR